MPSLDAVNLFKKFPVDQTIDIIVNSVYINKSVLPPSIKYPHKIITYMHNKIPLLAQ